MDEFYYKKATLEEIPSCKYLEGCSRESFRADSSERSLQDGQHRKGATGTVLQEGHCRSVTAGRLPQDGHCRKADTARSLQEGHSRKVGARSFLQEGRHRMVTVEVTQMADLQKAKLLFL